MPSRLGLLLDMTARSLERVIYYENYMVVDPGKTPLEPRQLLTDTEYRQALDEYGDGSFVAKMGAEAVRDGLAKMDLEATVAELHEQMRATRSKQIKKKLSKRLKVIQGFIHSKSRSGLDGARSPARSSRRICVLWCPSRAAGSRPPT